MFGLPCRSVCVAFAGGSVAYAAEPAATPVPQAVRSLTGCWSGSGVVMGKPVTVDLTARAIVQASMLAVDVDSRAKTDPSDRYTAHLVFGGGAPKPGSGEQPVVSYWADSFEGAFAAAGTGTARRGEFQVSYPYPANVFVNRWQVGRERLAWTTASRPRTNVEMPFASYSLRRRHCRSASR